MPNLKLKYYIENLNTGQFEDTWEIEGGLSIIKDGLILTKRIDDNDDDGFRGDYVYFNLYDWLTSVPKLLSGQRCKIDFYESVVAFLFRPDGDVTYFKYFIEGMGQLVENENKRYPNHEDGTPINTKELVLEIIKTSEELLLLLEPKIKDKSDIEGFKEAISDAREAYESFYRGAQ